MKMILSIYKAILGLASLGLLLILAINLWVIVSAQFQSKTPQQIQASDWASDQVPILVLGAGIIDNKEPSKVLAGRLNSALTLAQTFPNKALIMSGDHTNQYYNEVAVMKDYLVQHGVASQRIYLDHAGYSTYDSLYRLKHVLGQERVIIVTQGYHLSRALMLARGLGLQAVGLAAEEAASTRFKREFREIGARFKDFAVTYLGYQMPQPSLDYPIDFSQSGDLTDRIKVGD